MNDDDNEDDSIDDTHNPLSDSIEIEKRIENN